MVSNCFGNGKAGIIANIDHTPELIDQFEASYVK